MRYDRLALTDLFKLGIERVRDRSETDRVALMCAEKEPLDCHRTILVARSLHELGLDIQHIHADGNLETHDAAMSRLLVQLKMPEQDLFRSRKQVLADAYAAQGSRITYEPESPTEPSREAASG